MQFSKVEDFGVPCALEMADFQHRALSYSISVRERRAARAGPYAKP